jgi:hypothetical protein
MKSQKTYLGKLCEFNHESSNGQSLRFAANDRCVECQRLYANSDKGKQLLQSYGQRRSDGYRAFSQITEISVSHEIEINTNETGYSVRIYTKGLNPRLFDKELIYSCSEKRLEEAIEMAYMQAKYAIANSKPTTPKRNEGQGTYQGKPCRSNQSHVSNGATTRYVSTNRCKECQKDKNARHKEKKKSYIATAGELD